MSPEKFLLDLIESVGNIDFAIVSKALGFSFVVFWIIVVGWVWVDSKERSSSPIFRVLSILLVGILNVPGLIIYLIIRPRQSIAEVYWSDLERRYLRYETAELSDCYNCGFQLQPGFIHCPNCSAVIKVKCEGCGVYIEKDWKYCPFCSTQNKRAEQVEDLSKAVMEKRIEETKREAHEKVESKQTRYATETGFAVKVGDAVLGAVRGWGEIIDGAVRKPAKQAKKGKNKK